MGSSHPFRNLGRWDVGEVWSRPVSTRGFLGLLENTDSLIQVQRDPVCPWNPVTETDKYKVEVGVSTQGTSVDDDSGTKENESPGVR